MTAERWEGVCAPPCTDDATCRESYRCLAATPRTGEQGLAFCIKQEGSADAGPEDSSVRDSSIQDSNLADGACTANTSCPNGTVCSGGACLKTCSTNEQCPIEQLCTPNPNAPDAGPKGYCVAKSQDWGKGRYGSICPTGSAECDTAAGFDCVGTAGTADAYCSKKDACTKDSECPLGFWCGDVRRMKDANNVDFDNPAKACLRRTFCAPCETDLDCFHETNAICAPSKAGEKFCSLPCDPASKSCIFGTSCDDLGDGRFACRPEAGGVCHAEKPQGCSPCRIDSDCGKNAVCIRGKINWKPSMSWCSTVCGPVDADGKRGCPIAPNGQEMLCLDENQYSIGGPVTSTAPNSQYQHCYAPFTMDVSELYTKPPRNPPHNVCGNHIREGEEECDDANKSATDGCDNCRITEACTFKISEPNGDGTDGVSPTLSPAPKHVTATGPDVDPAMPFVISLWNCGTFRVEGAIENAGDTDTIAIGVDDSISLWVEAFTDKIGTCSADLIAETRAWKNGEKVTDKSLLDLNVPCEKLSNDVQFLADQKLCPDAPDHLACGSCAGAGICGVCDDDNGVGNCPRMLVNTMTKYSTVPVYFDGIYKVIRIRAKKPSATVVKYVVVGSRFESEAAIGPSTPPVLSCF